MSYAYTLVMIATVANLTTVYFMKLSNGMTNVWPTLAMLVANLLVMWPLGRAFASGANVGPALTALTVGVMIGSFFIGMAFGERITTYQATGALIAVAGVVVANMKGVPHF